MSNNPVVKSLTKMTIEQLAMMAAKRDLKALLGKAFTPDQKEVLFEALRWVSEDLQKTYNLRREIKAVLEKEEMDKHKSLAGTRGALKQLKLPGME